MDSRLDSVIIAKLPPEPLAAGELRSILAIAAASPHDGIMLDLAEVDTLSRPAIYRIMQLHRFLTTQHRRLSMANVAPSTRRNIISYGGQSLFTILDQCVISVQPSGGAPAEGHLTVVGRDRLRPAERRRYARFNIWGAVPVEVRLYGADAASPDEPCPATLVDISEGGARVAVAPRADALFELDKTVRMELSSNVFDIAATLHGIIRTILPTADDVYLSIGLQFADNQADEATRQLVHRLTGLQNRYLQTRPAEPAG